MSDYILNTKTEGVSVQNDFESVTLEPNESHFIDIEANGSHTTIHTYWSGLSDYSNFSSRIRIQPITKKGDVVGDFIQDVIENGSRLGSYSFKNTSVFYRVQIRNQSDETVELTRLSISSFSGSDGVIKAYEFDSERQYRPVPLSSVKDNNGQSILRVKNEDDRGYYPEHGDKGSFGVAINNMPDAFKSGGNQTLLASVRSLNMDDNFDDWVLGVTETHYRRGYFIFRSNKPFTGRIRVESRLKGSSSFGSNVDFLTVYDSSNGANDRFVSDDFMFFGTEFQILIENETGESVNMDFDIIGVDGPGRLFNE